MKSAIKDTNGLSGRISMGAFGAHSMKPTVLCSNAPWFPDFLDHAKGLTKREYFTKLAKTGSKWVTGDKTVLSKSADYPPRFCSDAIQTHLDFLEWKDTMQGLKGVEAALAKQKLHGSHDLCINLEDFVMG